MKDVFPAELAAGLFEQSEDAVIGVLNHVIAFMNPTAQRLFGMDETGHAASRLLPAHLLHAQAPAFASAAVIADRHVLVRVASAAAFRLYTLIPDEPETPPAGTGAVYAPQLTALANFRLITEYFLRCAEKQADSRFSRYAAQLLKCYCQVNRWTTNIVTFSALRAGTLPFQPVPVDAAELLRGMLDGIRFYASLHGIEIAFSAPEQGAVCALDPDLFERMTMNILANSLAHCKSGDRVSADLTVQGKTLLLSFHDTGSGIPPEKMSSVFRAYTVPSDDPGKEPRAGFGLAVALGIAELHRGTILVESTPQAGTSVRVTLSAAIPTPTQLRSAPVEYGTQPETNLLCGLADFLGVEDFTAGFPD